jgi:hypothetical protein
MEKSTAVKLVAAGAVGALQPFVIKKYLITGTNDTNLIPQLPYNMGTLSSLVNNGASIAAIAAAVAGMYRKGPAMLRQSEVQMMLLAYGVPALAIGLAMNMGIVSGVPMGMQSFRAGPSVNVRSQGIPQPINSGIPPRVYGAAQGQKFY